MEHLSAPIAPVQGRLHHVGFVVQSIAASAEGFSRSIAGAWDGRIIQDPLQGARVTFLRGPIPADALVELIEPVDEASPVSKFLKRGGGLHHLCYEVGNLETQLQYIRSTGSLVVRPPVPAVAFGGRRIAWVYTKAKLLLEYLETDGSTIAAL
ncbi:MAG TPA: VOC family protein [Terriglobia bacterium]|nr:VOC family protein [Terriglobia bacterium]